MSDRIDAAPPSPAIVDVIDAATKNIVWRGSATQDIDANAKPDKRDTNINKTAEKLLKNYPPQ